MPATLSILGVYQWDKTIFDELDFPVNLCSKNDLIDEILYQGAELELLYNQPQIIKAAIGRWSRRRYPIWLHLWETTQYEYDPIENYDRKEEWHDNVARNGEENTNTTRQSSGEASAESNNDRQLSVAAFDVPPPSTLSPKESETSENKTTNTSAANESLDDKYTKEEKEDTWRTGRAHGNIGVTTTQKMIREEREIADYDLFQQIVDEFILEFCVCVF